MEVGNKHPGLPSARGVTSIKNIAAVVFGIVLGGFVGELILGEGLVGAVVGGGTVFWGVLGVMFSKSKPEDTGTTDDPG